MTLGDRRLVHSKIRLATRFSMLISIPSTIGYMVLAKPIMNLLFNGNNSTPALLLITGAITITFYSLSTITNAMLQGIDRMTTPIKNAAISLVIHLISLFIMLVVLKMNIFAVIGSTIVFSLSMCILNGRALGKAIGYHQEYYKTFILPLIASIIMSSCIYRSDSTYKYCTGKGSHGYFCMCSNCYLLFSSTFAWRTYGK